MNVDRRACSVLTALLLVAPGSPSHCRSSHHQTRIIWIYWGQGWDAAPDLCRRCAALWRLLNKDWEVRLLDYRSAGTWVNMSTCYRVLPHRNTPAFADVCGGCLNFSSRTLIRVPPWPWAGTANGALARLRRAVGGRDRVPNATYHRRTYTPLRLLCLSPHQPARSTRTVRVFHDFWEELSVGGVRGNRAHTTARRRATISGGTHLIVVPLRSRAKAWASTVACLADTIVTPLATEEWDQGALHVVALPGGGTLGTACDKHQHARLHGKCHDPGQEARRPALLRPGLRSSALFKGLARRLQARPKRALVQANLEKSESRGLEKMREQPQRPPAHLHHRCHCCVSATVCGRGPLPEAPGPPIDEPRGACPRSHVSSPTRTLDALGPLVRCPSLWVIVERVHVHTAAEARLERSAHVTLELTTGHQWGPGVTRGAPGDARCSTPSNRPGPAVRTWQLVTYRDSAPWTLLTES